MMTTKQKLSPDDDIYFMVEKLRLAGYAGFWVIVITGIAITRLYSGIDLENTLLMEVFGYNNICVYFDYPPATYILPLLWGVTLVCLLGYLVAHWLQMKAEMQEGLISRRLYRFLSALKLFEGFTMVSFSTIFAVQPEAWNHTLYIHTAPFFLLQIGLVSLAMSNTIHGIKSGYWEQLGLPSWFAPGAKLYVVLFALVVCFKIPAATNAMMGSPWWEQTTTFMSIARLFDISFLICAAVIPMLKALYFVLAKGEKLEVVRLITRTT